MVRTVTEHVFEDLRVKDQLDPQNVDQGEHVGGPDCAVCESVGVCHLTAEKTVPFFVGQARAQALCGRESIVTGIHFCGDVALFARGIDQCADQRPIQCAAV